MEAALRDWNQLHYIMSPSHSWIFLLGTFSCHQITTSDKVFRVTSSGENSKLGIYCCSLAAHMYLYDGLTPSPQTHSLPSFPPSNLLKVTNSWKKNGSHVSDKSREGSSLGLEKPGYNSQLCHIASLQVITCLCSSHIKWRYKKSVTKVVSHLDSKLAISLNCHDLFYLLNWSLSYLRI